jgi:hypothetical protein
MKNVISNFCQSVFALLIALAIAIGGVVTLMYIFGMIVGGSTATELALSGSNLLGLAIKLCSVAVFVGLVVFYIQGKHELTLTDQEQDTDDTEMAR